MSVSDTITVMQNSISSAFVDIICMEKIEIQTFTHQTSITVKSKTNLFYWKFLLDSHSSSEIRSNLNIMVPGEGNDSPSSILAWKIPWTQEPGGLQSMGSLESDMTEWLHFHFSFHALEKEMATHSSVLAWRIPGTGKPGGLPSMGSHRVGHDCVT